MPVCRGTAARLSLIDEQLSGYQPVDYRPAGVIIHIGIRLRIRICQIARAALGVYHCLSYLEAIVFGNNGVVIVRFGNNAERFKERNAVAE